MTQETIALYSLIESLSGIEIQSFSLDEIEVLAQDRSMLPHRHDHYCCFLLERGAVNFSIDFQQMEVGTSSLLISCPGQVHQLGFARQAHGWMLACDAALIDPKARTVIDQAFSRIVLMRLDASSLDWFIHLFKLIHTRVHAGQPERFQVQLLQHLLNAFFYQAAHLFQIQEEQRIQQHTLRSVDLSKKFQQLVKVHFLNLKRPADYAAMLNITVSYLNDTVKSVTGFPSTYFIQQEVIQEAQRQLFYTTQSVKEIAYALGYEDGKYFTRLFSKLVGKSPTDFRKLHVSE